MDGNYGRKHGVERVVNVVEKRTYYHTKHKASDTKSPASNFTMECQKVGCDERSQILQNSHCQRVDEQASHRESRLPTDKGIASR